jgi:hypothetical protein
MNNKQLSLRLAGAFILLSLVLAILVVVPNGKAIPAFSRKYQTSCTTCHNDFPELNDFGEAFKKRGFKFPKDDETFVKQEPVMLGSKAQKEAFPDAVYPGEIPGAIPISLRYEGNFNWTAKQPNEVIKSSGFVPQTDLFVPNTFTIIGAGSFGQNFSFWIDDDISAGGTGAGGGLGDGWIKYNDLGHHFHLPLDALNVRFGQFELDLPVSQARTIYLSPYDVYNQQNVAGVQGTTVNPFFFGTPQRGIEFGGYPNDGNFMWSVAFIDGTNSNYGLGGSLTAQNTKDVYVRAAYKFNLERDPESRHAIQAAGPTGPHDHTSIRIGGFYYYGNNEQNFGGVDFPPYPTIVKEPFYRIGADIRYKYRNKLEVVGVGIVGHDNNHTFSTDGLTLLKGPKVTYTGGLVAVNYWIYPWLIATMRYDVVNSPTDWINMVSQYQTRNRFSPGYQILVRANIKIIGEFQSTWGRPYVIPAGLTQYYHPNTFVTGIDYVF